MFSAYAWDLPPALADAIVGRILNRPDQLCRTRCRDRFKPMPNIQGRSMMEVEI